MGAPSIARLWSLDILRYDRIGNLASPGGRFENSPPFQEWDRKEGAPSPEGTAELLPPVTLVASDFVLLQQGEKLS